MAFSRSVFTALLTVVCIASVRANEWENVPVFLWGDLPAPTAKANPLTMTTTPAFSAILSEELAEDPFTVVFIEQTLSVEDLSRRNADGKTPYPYLYENLPKSVYLPSVNNPVAAFDILTDPRQVDAVTLSQEGLSSFKVDGRFLFINLNDANEGESRAEMLRRHDGFMKDIVTDLKTEHASVVGIYTARHPSWAMDHERVRRQAENAQTTDFKLDGLRMYARNIKLVEEAKTTVYTGLSTSTTDFAAPWMNTTLNFSEGSMVLKFRSAAGYWFFDSVSLNSEDFRPKMDVYALIGFSYRCAQNVAFTHGNSTMRLFFEDLKVQPVFHNTTAEEPVVYGDSFNCVGFFSEAIWAGLFVVFILLAITFYGIMMMMDIRTMDRFDDPKGKTININAGE